MNSDKLNILAKKATAGYRRGILTVNGMGLSNAERLMLVSKACT